MAICPQVACTRVTWLEEWLVRLQAATALKAVVPPTTNSTVNSTDNNTDAVGYLHSASLENGATSQPTR